MEYDTVNTFASKQNCTGTEISGLEAGTYYVRVAETATHKAGAAATVEVPAYTAVVGTLGGSVTIEGDGKYDATLTAKTDGITGNTGTLSYQWKRGDEDIAEATSSTYKLTAADIGKNIKVAVSSSVETGTITSAEVTVEKADGPAAPSVKGVACTTSANKDGKITGVTTEMEYAKTSDFADKTVCTGTEITGLTNGKYYVRVAETETHKAGAAATVEVPAYSNGSTGGGSYYPYTPSTPSTPAAPNLDKTKTDSTTAINAAATANKYDAAEQAEVKKILDKANADIKNAKTEAEVKAIEEAAQAEIDKILTTEEKAIVAALDNVEKRDFATKSKVITRKGGKKVIRLTWTAPDGVDVDGYEIFRSTKKNSGFGKKPYFTTSNTSYTNTKDLKTGKTYYYKVRAFVVINGERVYTDYSLKANRKL